MGAQNITDMHTGGQEQSRVEQAIVDLGLEQPLSQPILLDENGDE